MATGTKSMSDDCGPELDTALKQVVVGDLIRKQHDGFGIIVVPTDWRLGLKANQQEGWYFAFGPLRFAVCRDIGEDQ